MELNDMIKAGVDTWAIRRRFLTHIRKKKGHWIWINSHRDDGQFYLKAKEVKPLPRQAHPKGKNVSARRLIYLLCYGEIPDGVNIKTACSVPACCNPEHLSINGKILKVIEPQDAFKEIGEILDAKPRRYKDELR
jgi:HNH endonuclease